MESSCAERRQWLLSIGLFSGALALYALTLTRIHTGDALAYTMAVESGDLRQLFHPHHLMYNFAGYLFYLLWRSIGWQGRALLPLQLLNAIVGALGILMFFAIAKRITRHDTIALISAALLGVSYGYWYYSLEVEVYIIASFFLLLCFWLTYNRFQMSSPKSCMLIGLLHGLAILFHQTNVLFIFVVLTALVLPTKSKRLCKAIASYLLSLALSAGLPYLLTGLVINHYSWGSFAHWIIGYAGQRSPSWGHFGPLSPIKAAIGLGRAIVFNGWLLRSLRYGVSMDLGALASKMMPTLIIALLTIAPILLRFKRISREHPRLTKLCLVWLISYGLFFTWWQPLNPEFWIASLIPIWMLFSLSLAWTPSGMAESSTVSRCSLFVAVILVLVLFLANLTDIRWHRDPHNDFLAQMATDIRNRTEQGDLIIFPSTSSIYIKYYGRRQNILSLDYVFDRFSSDKSQGFAFIDREIARTLEAGKSVFISSEEINPSPLRLAEYGLDRDEVNAFWARYERRLDPCLVYQNYQKEDWLPAKIKEFTLYQLQPE